MLKKLWTLMMIALVGAGGFAGYKLMRAQIAGEVYRQRLVNLQDDYQSLRAAFNKAVRKTAVTELRVKDGKLSIVVRNAEGTVKTIPTPFDPHHEIYVDYMVVDGRLWIRRVFDDQTPPSRGVTVDPKLAKVDWDAAGAAYGKAAYRRLTPGRWIVTVTGDGSLGLAKCDKCDQTDLRASPPVKSYHPRDRQAAATAAVDHITPADVLWHVMIEQKLGRK